MHGGSFSPQQTNYQCNMKWWSSRSRHWEDRSLKWSIVLIYYVVFGCQYKCMCVCVYVYVGLCLFYPCFVVNRFEWQGKSLFMKWVSYGNILASAIPAHYHLLNWCERHQNGLHSTKFLLWCVSIEEKTMIKQYLMWKFQFLLELFRFS